MPTSKAKGFPVRDVNEMTDDCLLNFAQEALQHCRQQLQLRQQKIAAQFSQRCQFDMLNGEAHNYQFYATDGLVSASKALFALCVQRQLCSTEIAQQLADMEEALLAFPSEDKGVVSVKQSLNMMKEFFATTVCCKIHDASDSWLAKGKIEHEANVQTIHELQKMLIVAGIAMDNLDKQKRVMLQSVMSRVAEFQGDDAEYIKWLQRWQWTPASNEESVRIRNMRHFFKVRRLMQEGMAFEKGVLAQSVGKEQFESRRRLAEIYYHMEADSSENIQSAIEVHKTIEGT